MVMVGKFNQTDDASTLGFTLPQLLQINSISHGNKTAVICANTSLSYDGLHVQANRLAGWLARRGIGPGCLVGVALDRSADLVVVLVAVLQSGAAYMPLDPAFPAERLNQMIQDAKPELLVAEANILGSVSQSGVDICGIEDVRQAMGSNEGYGHTDVQLQPEDLAFVIYTSGSTGRAKGVEISHGAACNFVLSLLKETGHNGDDRMLAIAPVGFDMAFYELILPLTCSGTVVIAQTHELKDPTALLGLMEEHAITVVSATPTRWQILIDSGWGNAPKLKIIMSGGEVLSRRLAEHLLDYSERVFNGYGPTEATVCTSLWRVRRGQEVIVGRPLANVRLYVLGPDLVPVPEGCSGELYIAGAGLARGYRHNPELTSSAFVPDPFHEGRMYRSGDSARFLSADELVVLGRVDSQVKVRGNRVEIGDIESAMAAHTCVSAAIVTADDDRLTGYYTRAAKNGHESSEKVEESTEFQGRLREWLAERLPAYMIPAFLVELQLFPVTVNGKIDRKKISQPVADFHLPAEMGRWTEMQRQMWFIWSNVLGHSQIDLDDNFFHKGGDSARVVQVHAGLLKLLDRPVVLAKLFEHYTIRTLTAYLTSNDRSDEDLPVQKQHKYGDRRKEPIAVVSMACRLPGGVNTPEEFWQLLESGKDAVVDVPKDRWDVDAVYDVDPDSPGKTYCRTGCFLTSINSFDPPAIGITPLEADQISKEQLIMHETCWEAFERAGYTTQQLNGSRTGVYIGLINAPAYSANGAGEPPDHGGTGAIGSMASGRISHTLGLEGPSLTIDTACSSSLVATHLAINALQQGECDMAIAGGVNLILTPALHVEFSRLGAMSPDGRCRAFASDTEGTGWGEGCAAVVLKRLSDAQRDGDQVLATLSGNAVNHDGHSSNLTAPSGSAQRRLILAALASSGLQPSDIDYIEAHGTGTKLGDSIEATALAEVFGGSRSENTPLWVGSVKSNVGHTQAAAGMVGLLKVVLAMQHGILPRSLHVEEPITTVDWASAGMAVVQTQRSWASTTNRLRRAGVSAFGVSGTNSHIIVEEAPSPTVLNIPRESVSATLLSSLPVLVSGRSEAALRQQIRNLRSYLRSRDAKDLRLSDVAFSLATSRNHHDRRLTFMAGSLAQLDEKLSLELAAQEAPAGFSHEVRKPCIAMLFTGQGGRLLQMGKELASYHPVFRAAVDEVAGNFEGRLQDVMWADPDSENAALLRRTDYAQPALFSIQVTLWRLWNSWGVQPQFVLGHSAGELAAAHVAGIMDLPDACRLVAARSRLMQAVNRAGKMAALKVGPSETLKAIVELDIGARVGIAAYNSPEETVVSGDIDAIEALCHFVSRQGHGFKVLEASHAFHSHHMDSLLADLQAVAGTLHFSPPKVAVVSTLTGKLAEPGQLEQAAYWVRQVREAVRFSDGIRELSNQGANTFIELGPSPTLCGMGAVCLSSETMRGDTGLGLAWVPSLIPKKGDVTVIQKSLTVLHARHVDIDWKAYFEPFSCKRVPLPTYAFQREVIGPNRAAVTSDVNGHATTSSEGTKHPSIGSFPLKIKWEPIDVDNIRPRRGIWGLWGPVVASAGTVSLTDYLRNALSDVEGLSLVRVNELEEVGGLDGLICPWESDTASHTPSQAGQLTMEALAQLQKLSSVQFSGSVVWVTRQAIGTGAAASELLQGIGAAPLWGLMRSVRGEGSEMRLRLVDLDAKTEAEETISNVVSLILALDDEPECAIRGNQILVPRIAHAEDPGPVAPSLKAEPMIRPDGAILMTGGLGDLGAHVARFLAISHGVRDLVLVSRRGMNTPNAKSVVAELASLGAKVTVVTGNVGELESMQRIMELFSRSRPLRGVVHTAGVADTGILSTLRPERCPAVFAPKVSGAWNMDLDIFVLFSSISGVIGLPGVGLYAAANAFLDALAHLRIATGLPATSVAFGTWQGDGMAAGHSGTIRAHNSQFGRSPLTHEEGLRLFQQAALSGRALTVATSLDLKWLQSHFDDRGGVPALFCSLLGQRGSQPGQNLRGAWTAAPTKQRPGILLRMVQETIASALAFAHPDDVDVHKRLQDVGIDSLTAVLIRNHLSVLTGLKLSANFTYHHQSVKALSDHLTSKLQSAWDADDVASTSVVSQSSNLDSVTNTPLSTDYPSVNLASICKGCLDASLTFENATRCAKRPNSVLVTGSTGFVGAFIVYELLKQGITVHCLVRADNDSHARQRVVDTLIWYGLWEARFAPILHIIVGNITQPLFGLDGPLFDELAETIDAICHSAGLVDWMRPLDDYVGPNMVSTHEVLRLASRGRGKAVHLVSTIATLPMHLGWDVSEDQYEHSYATSKMMAERMVSAARWRGASASVYRMPFVFASSTGHFRLDRGDFLHNLIAGSIQMGSFPIVNADLSTVLPVDYLCRSMVDIVTRDVSRIGQDFDFKHEDAPTFGDLFGMMVAAGAANGPIPFSDWRQRALTHASAHPTSSLARIATVLDGCDEEALAAMFGTLPLGQNILDGIKSNNHSAPLVGIQFVKNYLDRISAVSQSDLKTV
ncbi:unnamed protein product [Clonostachys rosea]|uniref:Carrier domain-containing protein n=1 Tax=Bionectria ochroleuca TaxID=29856 RepID=A0ABY6U672_BIOOC|nr:unnamed protein product [Clonostachys rosea]